MGNNLAPKLELRILSSTSLTLVKKAVTCSKDKERARDKLTASTLETVSRFMRAMETFLGIAEVMVGVERCEDGL